VTLGKKVSGVRVPGSATASTLLGVKKILGRRTFLRAGAAAVPLLAHTARAAASERTTTASRLVADPNGVIDLPPGFSYRVLTRTGDPMSDGHRTPGNPDAMGVFMGERGKIIVMRNHEILPGDAANGPYPAGHGPAPEAYDPEGYGGVSRMVIDPDTLAVEQTNLVLAGTHLNCAGGLSPWGWLSCEETVIANHGYVFLCSTTTTTVERPQPIRAYGRFRHEAATADPKTHIAFLTEDMEDAAFYRFVPRDRAKPFEGQLQALAIAGAPRFDTTAMVPGQRLAVHWLNVDDPDPREDTVRYQARDKGAAQFRRTEGLWLAGDELYITATTGGPIGRGQIFRLHDGTTAAAELELVAHTVDPNVLDMPDNITVSPLGHVYLAEDGLDGNFLRRLTLDGRIVPFARNALSLSEFAGLCFSPDGSVLFVNMQHDGLTVAIRGPFGDDSDAAGSGRMPMHRSPAGVAGLAAGLGVMALAAFARRRQHASGER